MEIQCHVGPYPVLCLQNNKSDIGPQEKWTRLVMTTLIFPNGLCEYVWVNLLTVSLLRDMVSLEDIIGSL